jgi:hypothetical protein
MTTCPHCHRDAPLVYRGPLAYCTACGGVRTPLSGPSVNLAGKPLQMGGAVTRVVGWVVLLIGLATALGLWLLVGALATAAVAAAFAAPVALVALVAGLVLLRGGRSLRSSGEDTERATREQALLELAAHRGAITAGEAARSLGMDVAEADAMLTAMAKREPDRVAIDIDDQGRVWYRPARAAFFPGEPIDGARVGDRVRVGDGEAPRVADEAGAAEDETAGEREANRTMRR